MTLGNGGRPYDLYQVPVSGGLPIKMVALDNSKRPFTPPFAQLIKVSHRQPNSSTTKDQDSTSSANRKESDFMRDSLERLSDPRKSGTKEYIYDAKLKCYYDPETNEYFEDVRGTLLT